MTIDSARYALPELADKDNGTNNYMYEFKTSGVASPVLMVGCKCNFADSSQPLINISFPKNVGEGEGGGGGACIVKQPPFCNFSFIFS